MATEDDNPNQPAQSEGTTTPDFNSGELTPVATSTRTAGLGLGPEESRKRAAESHQRRLTELRARVPERTVKLIENIPVKYQGRHVRAMAKECSIQQAVIANCHACIGWEDVKAAIGGCTSFSCALWQWRPYQNGQEEQDDTNQVAEG